MTKTRSYYQSGSIASLLAGVYDGDLQIKSLYQHGDFGLGTLDGVNGEVVIDRGKFYVCDQQGQARLLKGDETTPFSVVTFFEAEKTFTLDAINSLDHMAEQVDAHLQSVNQMAAVRISGKFSYIKARSECAQPKPYRPLAETLPEVQNIFEWHDLSGVMVATRFPSYMASINAHHYHLHFISDDKQLGGHVFDFVADQPTTIEVCKVKRLIMDSIDNDLFDQNTINAVDDAANQAVEKHTDD